MLRQQMLEHFGNDFVSISRFDDTDRRLPGTKPRYFRALDQVLRNVRNFLVYDILRDLDIKGLPAPGDVG